MEKQRERAAQEHIQEFKMAQVFRAWHQARPTRIAYQTRILRITELLAHKKQRQTFFTLQLNIKQKIAQRLDKRLLKKYMKYRYHHKLFVEWRSKQRRLIEMRDIAVGVLQGREAPQYDYMLEKPNYESCKYLMFDEAYHALQVQRKNNNDKIMAISEKIRNFYVKRACITTINTTTLNHAHSCAALAPDRPADQTVFPSFIKAQNPNAYTDIGNDSQEAMNVKYDIHALLVDAQNYYVQEQGPEDELPPASQYDTQELIKHRQLALIRYDRAKMREQRESAAQSSRATDMPRTID